MTREGTIDVCGSCSTMRKSYEHFQRCAYKGCPFVRANEAVALLRHFTGLTSDSDRLAFRDKACSFLAKLDNQ